MLNPIPRMKAIAEVPEAWRCNECMTVYDNEDDAVECCQPRVTEGYICPVCGSFHMNADRAVDCCGFDPDAPPPPPSAEELEAAGQMRLMP